MLRTEVSNYLTNHKPEIKGTDHGIWRRIKLIPFTQTIPDEEQDRDLEKKLKEERSGILNWLTVRAPTGAHYNQFHIQQDAKRLMEGAMRWKNEGLVVPDIIRNATNEYRGEMDIIGNFISEQCEEAPGAQIRIRELFKAYRLAPLIAAQ